MNLSVLLGKELREQWRTYRLLAMALVFVAFAGLLSPIVAKVTPELLKNLPTGTGQTITIELPEPTAVDAIAQYLKNLTQTGIIVLILVAMGTVAQERERGTVVTVLSKPVSRLSFLRAKFIALTLTLAASLVLATLACWTYTVVLFGPFDAGVFFRASLLSALYLWVFLAVTFLCSTLTRSPIAAGELSIGIVGGHQDDRGRAGVLDVPRGLNTAHLRHLDIHQDEIGLQLLREGHGLLTIACLTHDLEAQAVQNATGGASKQLVVVDQHDTCRLIQPVLVLHQSPSRKKSLALPNNQA